MSHDYKPNAEMLTLLQALADDTVTSKQHEQLQQLLRGNPESQCYFLEWIRLHSTLDWHSADLSTISSPLMDEVESSNPNSINGNTKSPSTEVRSSSRYTQILRSKFSWSALAASLLFCMAWIGSTLLPHEDSYVTPVLNPNHVGIVRTLETPFWETSNHLGEEGELVSQGRYTLSAGMVRIETFQGATLTMTAPCDVTFESAEKVDCHQGRLLVNVIREDAELVVTTPVGEMLHIGTEFGIDVTSPETTELYVFDGAVELRSGLKKSLTDSARVIPMGTAIRVETSGKVAAIEPDEDLLQAPKFHRLGSNIPHEPSPIQVSPEGFQVLYVKSNNEPIVGLKQADKLLSGALEPSEKHLVSGVPFIDFEDKLFDRSYTNLFSLDYAFPGDPEGQEDDDDQFAIRANAKISVHDTWLYSFLVNVDDGARLRIDGRDVIVDDGIHPPQVIIGTVLLSAGEHDIELVAYDNKMFSRIELATAVGRTRQLQQFRLLEVEQAEVDRMLTQNH